MNESNKRINKSTEPPTAQTTFSIDAEGMAAYGLELVTFLSKQQLEVKVYDGESLFLLGCCSLDLSVGSAGEFGG